MTYTVLPAMNDVTPYDAARDQHIQAGIAAAAATADSAATAAASATAAVAAAATKIILIDTVAALPGGTPVGTIVVVKA
jgi:hypothetical protein